MKAVEW